ncbi:MAG: universal stress protein, partial [Candidatus Dormibacteraceae bacterium]
MLLGEAADRGLDDHEETTMYHRILVAADSGGLAAEAAPAVAALAEPRDAQVLVVSIHVRVTPDRERRGEEFLQNLVHQLRERHLNVRVERPEPAGESVAQGIADAAQAFGADLIVLGSRRHGDVFGFFAGSVGHALAARVRIPILF